MKFPKTGVRQTELFCFQGLRNSTINLKKKHFCSIWTVFFYLYLFIVRPSQDKKKALNTNEALSFVSSSLKTGLIWPGLVQLSSAQS